MSAFANGQLSLADTLASNSRPAEALQWYRKAAAQGSIEAIYHVGELLLFGMHGIPNAQSVGAHPPEGVAARFKQPQTGTRTPAGTCPRLFNAALA